MGASLGNPRFEGWRGRGPESSWIGVVMGMTAFEPRAKLRRYGYGLRVVRGLLSAHGFGDPQAVTSRAVELYGKGFALAWPGIALQFVEGSRQSVPDIWEQRC